LFRRFPASWTFEDPARETVADLAFESFFYDGPAGSGRSGRPLDDPTPPRMRSHSVAAVCLALAAIACTPAERVDGAAGPPTGLTWSEVLPLKAARDYFTLRDRLAAAEPAETPPVRFARAIVEHAFNQPAASNATIAALLEEAALPDSLVVALQEVEVANHLRLFQYASGLAVTDRLLADSARLEASRLRDLRNVRRIFHALAEVPPQTAELRGPAALRLEEGRIPLQVNESTRHYVFDTGANLSTIMRSEAEALGLRVYPADIDVGTSTDLRVTADLAVADRLVLGQVEYRHVVFLVLEDSLLSFPGGFRIPGIVGFPVIEQLGEVRFGRDGEVTIPVPVPPRAERNLALEQLTPLTRVRWLDADDRAPLLCRLDTGADRTQFYEPFYRRYRAGIDAVTSPVTRRSGGAGGIRELPARVLPSAWLAVGDTTVALDSTEVLLQPIVREASENYLDCNLGHDVFGAFSSYIINFRDMAFLLR
jgi:hypothetical protein